MQNLKSVVDLYLKMETNYALLITGPWGAGKTYYLKHTLFPQIEETSVFSDNEKTYRPITVSLFGLKSIEEVQSQILLSLYPILKNRKIKIGANITKAFIKGYMTLKGLGEYYTIIEEASKIKKSDLYEWINLEDLVICFDDLERMDEALNIKQLIGYINSLVETQNIKVLILTNEGEIKDKNYDEVKEKVVGNTIEFRLNLKEVFPSIVSNKFSGYPAYKKYLLLNSENIINVFLPLSSNLRILSFALAYFHRIHTEVEMHLRSTKALVEKKGEILQNLLTFTLAISIEYQQRSISYNNREGLDWVGYELLGTSSKPQEKKNYRDKFKDKYFNGHSFRFYESIYNYVTGGEVFSYGELFRDLKSIYHIKDDVIEPQYQVLEKLGYNGCFSLQDREYADLTRQLLTYAVIPGSFGLQDCITVFHFLTRFNNPLRLNIQRLEKRIVKSMEIGTSVYVPQLDMFLQLDNRTEFYENLSNIRTAAIRINAKIFNSLQVAKYKELEKLCYSDFTSFRLTVLDIQQGYHLKPVLEYFSPQKFFALFHTHSALRWEILLFIKLRYNTGSIYLKPELEFLTQLLERTKKVAERKKGRNISGHLYNLLALEIQTSIECLQV
jgi:hypothetical protein